MNRPTTPAPMLAMQHDIRKKSATGFGSWFQCERCGATNHSGHWWYAGYKSKAEPSCDAEGLAAWMQQAQKDPEVFGDK